MTEAVLDRLQCLDQGLQTQGVKRPDRARVLINACIEEGIVSGPSIVSTLVALGFNQQHVGLTLKKGKRNPLWPEWGRQTDGTYYVPEPGTPTL